MPDKRSESNRFQFTISSIDKLAHPAAGRVVYHDEGCDNLALVVSPASKTFYWSGRSAGRPTNLFVGKFPEMGVETARKKTRGLSAARDEGRDPAAERKEKRKEPTLAELWDAYLEHHAKPRKKTWKDDERQYNKYMAGFKHKRLSAITLNVVAKWHGDTAKDSGPVQANRSKALLSAMFSKAAARVGYTGPNPVKGVAHFPEHSRERFLLPAEMKAFFTALAAEDVYWQGFFLLCLFTGCRRGNVAEMEWAEIDLGNAVWHIPGSKTKNKRPTTISLCEPALAIVKARHEQRNGSPYVFPAFKGDGPVVNVTHAWERILEASKLENLHIHDLRRTQGSIQAGMGISLAIIGKSLGHADQRSTQVYARLQLDPVKAAVAGASALMIESGGIKINGGGVELVVIEPEKEGNE